jgi:DNA invertase Pin-like site-specific DNA recombinase
MKTIIYYRKSTDRDDKQANSLEHQLGNCRRVAVSHGFDVLKEIGESRSAKTEFTRPGFNELIKTCKTGKVDFIIIDEPKRLSRNNIDTSRIIDLLDKNQIK